MATPGSEGLVGNIIRDVVGRRPRPERASSYASLGKLRQHRVRTLLLVDDYSGTGDQVLKYVDAWMRHPTIKSWHSYGWVRIHVLLLAASTHAQRRLENRFVAGLDYIESGTSFDTAPWTQSEREDVEAFCRRYAHEARFRCWLRRSPRFARIAPHCAE
ncbi:phosphoribosyltransferase-like protein [Yinghuangia aomiensis]